jgi:hypothetical protein
MQAKPLLLSFILILVVFGTAINTALGAIDPASIVGLWLFDETEVALARDSSGRAHDGEITGAKRVAGKFGKALEFDGDDFVTVPDAEDLRIGDQFTMQAWFFARDIGSWRQLIAKDNEYLLRIDPPAEGNRMSAFVRVGGAWEPRASAFVPSLETWTHFAATYDGDQLIVYVDGALSGQSSRPGNIQQTNNPVEFGRWGGALIGEDIGYFIGMIDEIAIFDDVLTEDDIAETMDGLQVFRVSVEALGKIAITWGKIRLMSN